MFNYFFSFYLLDLILPGDRRNDCVRYAENLVCQKPCLIEAKLKNRSCFKHYISILRHTSREKTLHSSEKPIDRPKTYKDPSKTIKPIKTKRWQTHQTHHQTIKNHKHPLNQTQQNPIIKPNQAHAICLYPPSIHLQGLRLGCLGFLELLRTLGRASRLLRGNPFFLLIRVEKYITC